MRASQILLLSSLILAGAQAALAANTEFIFRARPGLLGHAGSGETSNPVALAVPPLPPLTVGSPWSVQISATGGDSSQYSFSIAPSAGWLSLDHASGVLSGTPDAAGALGVFTLSVTDGSTEDSDSVSLTANDPLLASVSDVAEGAGAEISRTVAAIGGKPPYSYSWTDPSEVPAWLEISDEGVVSGTAETIGDWLLGITVSDADGRQSFTDISINVQQVSYWTALLGSAALDNATDLAVAGDGSVYVVGDTAAHGTKDILIMKYDPDGSLAWSRTLGSSGQDGANAVAVGPGGTVYLAGLTDGPGTSGGYDALVAKYSSGGELLWKTTFGLTSTSYDQLNSLDVASDGAVYVAGMTDRADFDVLVAKLAASGNIEWIKTAGASGDDRAQAIKVAGDGSFYVAGNTTVAGKSNDALVAKFDAAGAAIWAKTFGGAAADYGRGLAIRSDGAVVMSGYFGSPQDALLVSLSPEGTVLSSIIHGGSGNDWGTEVLLGDDGNIHVAGYTNSYGAGNQDVALMSYSSPASLTGTRLLGGTSADVATAIGKGAGGTLYLAGRTQSAGSGSGDVLVVRMPAAGASGFTGASALSVGQASMPYKGSATAASVSRPSGSAVAVMSTIAMVEGNGSGLQHVLLPME